MSGCSISVHTSVERSWNARCTTGMIRASEGASMKWTNLVSRRVCKQAEVFLVGSCSAASNSGTMAGKGNSLVNTHLNRKIKQHLTFTFLSLFQQFQPHKLTTPGFSKCHKTLSLTLDLWVPDNWANEPECLAACPLYLHVWVTEHLNEPGHNGRQAWG